MRELKVIYISFDGVLEALGQSQIVRLLEAMSKYPHIKFTLLSLEKPGYLSKKSELEALRRRFEESDVTWVFGPYEFGIKGIARNLMVMSEMYREALEAGHDLVHTRSYLSALVKLLNSDGGKQLPQVFDFRGYWVDERIEEGRWFTNPLALKVGRTVERTLFESSDAIVSLTETGIADIKSGHFGNIEAEHLTVIPTCVDEELFTIGKRSSLRPEPLQGKHVVGWVGSLNASYMVEESLTLVASLQRNNPDCFFLGLTSQTALLEEECDRFGIAASRRMIMSVSPGEIAQWMSWMDFGLLILKKNVAKRGSMPTKLGEFLASGVRPIFRGCNADMERWIEKAGTGLPAEHVKKNPVLVSLETKELELGWDRVRDHFSLDSGVVRYLTLYDSLLSS